MTPGHGGQSLRALIIGALAAVVVGCSTAGGGALPSAGSPADPVGRAVGSSATGSSNGPISDTPLRVHLDKGESFVSVDPSGRRLVTSTVNSICLRSGSGFDQRHCLESDSSAWWSPSWSQDGRRVALVKAGSRRGGENNDSVWVLDVSAVTLVAVSPTDVWLSGPVLPFWQANGRLQYTWPSAEVTEIRSWSTGHDTETVARLAHQQVVAILRSGSAGTLVRVETRHELGIIAWLTPTGALKRVRSVVLDHIVAVDPQGRFMVTQFPDVHAPGPLTLVALSTGEESELAPTARGLTFAPAGEWLAGLTAASSGYELKVWRVAPKTVPTTSISFDMPDRTYFYSGLIWTAVGVFAPASTDGAAQQVLVFPNRPPDQLAGHRAETESPSAQWEPMPGGGICGTRITDRPLMADSGILADIRVEPAPGSAYSTIVLTNTSSAPLNIRLNASPLVVIDDTGQMIGSVSNTDDIQGEVTVAPGKSVRNRFLPDVTYCSGGPLAAGHYRAVAMTATLREIYVGAPGHLLRSDPVRIDVGKRGQLTRSHS